jgi:hypothetical protein
MNKAIKNKEIIKEWKKMRIYMIHKRDDTNDLDKYRGISLSIALYKILMKIITNRLTKAIGIVDLIHESQGIEKLGLALYNEARILHNIIEDVNQNNREIHVCYIDITKAYDMTEYCTVRTIN